MSFTSSSRSLKATLPGGLAALSTVPYSEEVCQSIVGTLLQVSLDNSLRPLIPVHVWAWLKKRPSLPPSYFRRYKASEPILVRHIRGLGDIEILKSFLLILSEWNHAYDISEILISIEKDFGGIGMQSHRDDLIRHLNHVLGQLDRGWESRTYEWEPEMRKLDYKVLKDVLLEVDKRTALTCTPPRFILFNSRTNPRG